MKILCKAAILTITPLLMLTADISFLIGDLVPDANAVLGVRRRAVRRGVIIGSAASTSAGTAATAQQQAATAQQQAAAAAGTSVSGNALPLGTVVNALPAGCAPKQVNGIEYYHCGGNYYRSAFQGNSLVYVTTQP